MKTNKEIYKVLHDWDNPFPSGKYAFKKGIKLIVYCFCKTLGIKIKFVEDIYNSCFDNMIHLLMLNELINIKPIIGIKKEVMNEFRDKINELHKLGYDIRDHRHIGDRNNPDRLRTHFPINGLDKIDSDIWHYDTDYVAGKAPKLKDGQVPIFHIDYPERLPYYIKFLHEALIEKKEIYENEFD